MKTKSVISKFKKINIEFKREGNTLTAIVNSEYIAKFNDQDGEAVILRLELNNDKLEESNDNYHYDIKPWFYVGSPTTLISYLKSSGALREVA